MSRRLSRSSTSTSGRCSGSSSAALDDANIGRFVGMLEGLKEQTQFVLITHSRKTMSIADQLYGVTMEEPGVSKLVSVRFT